MDDNNISRDDLNHSLSDHRFNSLSAQQIPEDVSSSRTFATTSRSKNEHKETANSALGSTRMESGEHNGVL